MVYDQKKWGTWNFCFVRTLAFKYLQILDWSSFCSCFKYFRVELPLVKAFHAITSLASSSTLPSQPSDEGSVWVLLSVMDGQGSLGDKG